MNNTGELDRSFLALSHPVRRAIVERLVAGPASVGQASGGLGVSKPAVTKHLKVLEDAGLVGRTVKGRTHVLRLEQHGMKHEDALAEATRRDSEATRILATETALSYESRAFLAVNLLTHDIAPLIDLANDGQTTLPET